jgi:hypothetical protein
MFGIRTIGRRSVASGLAAAMLIATSPAIAAAAPPDQLAFAETDPLVTFDSLNIVGGQMVSDVVIGPSR